MRGGQVGRAMKITRGGEFWDFQCEIVIGARERN
jgi:hypothetical protein